MSERRDRLLVSTRWEGVTAVVDLDGELDRNTAPVFARAVEHLLDVGAARLEVDATGVAFADTAGVRVLLIARSRVAERGGDLRLIRVSAPLDRMLGASGLHSVLGVPRPGGQP